MLSAIFNAFNLFITIRYTTEVPDEDNITQLDLEPNSTTEVPDEEDNIAQLGKEPNNTTEQTESVDIQHRLVVDG